MQSRARREGDSAHEPADILHGAACSAHSAHMPEVRPWAACSPQRQDASSALYRLWRRDTAQAAYESLPSQVARKTGPRALPSRAQARFGLVDAINCPVAEHGWDVSISFPSASSPSPTCWRRGRRVRKKNWNASRPPIRREATSTGTYSPTPRALSSGAKHSWNVRPRSSGRTTSLYGGFYPITRDWLDKGIDFVRNLDIADDSKALIFERKCCKAFQDRRVKC